MLNAKGGLGLQNHNSQTKMVLILKMCMSYNNNIIRLMYQTNMKLHKSSILKES